MSTCRLHIYIQQRKINLAVFGAKEKTFYLFIIINQDVYPAELEDDECADNLPRALGLKRGMVVLKKIMNTKG